MSLIDEVMAGNRAAVEELITVAGMAASHWTVPRAPGEWSPSQLTEHVARAIEESANVAADLPSKFPTFPSFVRPLVRGLFFNRVLKTRSFPKAKTNKPFDPETGPASPAKAKSRLNDAVAKFDKACRACAESGGIVKSTIFGEVPVEDYARFQEYHTRHHRKQLAAQGSPLPEQISP